MEPWTSHSMLRLKYIKCFSIFLFPIPYHIYHEGHDYLRMFFQIQDIWRTLKSKEGRYGVLDFTYHVTFEIQNAFWPFIFPILLISIMNFMIIWEYSFKYKSYGGTKSQKKVDMLPWTSNNMSHLKFNMLFYPPYHIYQEGHDFLKIFFQIQVILRTLKSQEVDMEPWTSHSMSRLKF